jgi:hypothetical protein
MKIIVGESHWYFPITALTSVVSSTFPLHCNDASCPCCHAAAEENWTDSPPTWTMPVHFATFFQVMDPCDDPILLHHEYSIELAIEDFVSQAGES